MYRNNIIEKPVPVEVLVEKQVEVPIKHIVEKPVYYDNLIEKHIEKIIEVPVKWE